MGKERYWGGGRPSKRGGDNQKETSPGCMCAVFHLFDFHQFQFAINQQPSFKFGSSLPDEPTIPKGTEAPRNSLELEQPQLEPNRKDGELCLDIPMGIQIKTGGDRRSKQEGHCCDSSSSSAATPEIARTPTLVARLMGLDLLPDSCSSSPRVSSTLERPTTIPGKSPSLSGRPRKPRSSDQKSWSENYGDVNAGTRSLPETPRMSSARRSVDADRRLSLHISKENLNSSEELEFSRFTTLRRKEFKCEDENRSPSYYARQIVKQVKESVGRKVGMDITNVVRNSEQGRDSNVEAVKKHFKSRKSSWIGAKATEDNSSPGKQEQSMTFSPRLRLLEMREKKIRPPSNVKDQVSQTPRPGSSPPSPSNVIELQVQPTKGTVKPKPQAPEGQELNQRKSSEKCKAAMERFKKPSRASTLNSIRNKQEELFVRPTQAAATSSPNAPDKKRKKTAYTGDMRSIAVATLLPVKRDPSPPATKIPQKQVHGAHASKQSSQLSGGSSPQEATHVRGARKGEDDRSNAGASSATTGAVAAELQYVTLVLKHLGIERPTSLLAFTRWFSPSHPLDPSIFEHLELSSSTSPTDGGASAATEISNGQLQHKCDRKLLFDILDEILVEVLKPCLNLKPWAGAFERHSHRHHHRHDKGSQLIDTLCTKIKSFPRADCRVLEDIDALIDKDLPHMKHQSSRALEEEGDGLVAEIERDILDTLVQETAAAMAMAMA
ncbi:uncharacterized protein LOC104449319 [Eucalyptus grandis]|uniref:uncharacterized protein LOC104449319 n=1 Tax=Eucalyptus grandis TaxID=71139 RepID=UPI000525122D|nr:uncharacterized protein LOC104449319 [Eucalyptus grandis]